MNDIITFDAALEKLGISEYKSRIFNSNSRGELSHLPDYIMLAEMRDVTWFKKWFDAVVNDAQKTWERPESVFQHIPTILNQQAKEIMDSKEIN